MKWKLGLAVVLIFIVAGLIEAGGGRSGSSGSRSSSSSSSSSGSGSRSGPSSGSRSGPSSGSKYTGGSPSKPSDSKPSSGSKYTGGSPSKSSDSKSSDKIGSSPPGAGSVSSKPDSRKLTSGGLSEKGRASEQVRSQRLYAETQKAIAPPKPSFTDGSGKTIRVDGNAKSVEIIRSKPSSYYRPEMVQQRTEVHINHHYSHPYGWYYSQPPMYIGGGYNSAFWWMMMEWNAERRAAWFYHNRDTIDREAYERGLRDAKVAEAIRRMEAEKQARQSGYVDPEFKDDPSIIMDPNYIEAVYNPEIVQPSRGLGFVALFFIIALSLVAAAVLLWLLYWLIFVIKFNKQT